MEADARSHEVNRIVVEIPQYIQKIKLSEKRRTYYYEEHIDELPERYYKPHYVWRRIPGQKREIADTGKFIPLFRLFNEKTQKFVVKNPSTAGKPRWLSIGGNIIWEQVHESTRTEIANKIKDSMRPLVQKYREEFKRLRFPVMVTGEVHTTPKFCNWDLSNLWVYNKVFEDLLRAERLLPDDSILYITLPMAPRFIPIRNDEDRKMVFTFNSDNDPRIINHLMYNLYPKEAKFITSDDFQYQHIFRVKRALCPTDVMIIHTDQRLIEIGIGKKKIIPGAVTNLMNKLYWECINMDDGVIFDEKEYLDIQEFVDTYLLKRGIPVYILKTNQ
jgi:hypothetical protein